MKKDLVQSTYEVVSAINHGIVVVNDKGEKTVQSVGDVPGGAAAKFGRVERHLETIVKGIHTDRADAQEKHKVLKKTVIEPTKEGEEPKEEVTLDTEAEGYADYIAYMTELLDEEVEIPYKIKDSDLRDAVIKPHELISFLSAVGIIVED